MRWLPVLFVAACASSEAAEQRELPSTSVLCQVWKGTGEQSGPGVLRGYGTLSTDVEGVLGAPSERGGTWVYDYGASKLTVTFEKADLCVRDRKVSGLWVSGLKLDGAQPPKCWADSQDAEPCDGCIAPFEARDCR